MRASVASGVRVGCRYFDWDCDDIVKLVEFDNMLYGRHGSWHQPFRDDYLKDVQVRLVHLVRCGVLGRQHDQVKVPADPLAAEA